MSRVAEPFGTCRERGLYLPEADALVVADLHLGRTAAAGVDAPLDEGRATVTALLRLVEWFQPAEVVLAGDVLHAHAAVPREARATLATLRSRVTAAGARLVTVAGNHDGQLAALDEEPPAEHRRLPDGTVVCHGHEPPSATGRRYVVGHDHPAIVIEGHRRPCFLYGPAAHEGADVIALPSFNPGVAGVVVNGLTDGDALSPLLARVSRFHPVVWDDEGGEALVFPALDTLRPYL